MRPAALRFVLSFAVFVLARPAFADGGDAAIDAGTTEASGECEGGAACEDAAAEAAPPSFVVACDGDLCDTLQGRPSCTVAGVGGGLGSGVAGGVAAAAIAAAAVLSRRARRGVLPRIGKRSAVTRPVA